uniref:hypothetical protein n=1 Tax=Streptomyces sp. CHD11 TaxID=2741325 RepID=UPI002040A660|nr:hypothetical protein [Streptomyces sp. CHD11]
MANLVDEYGTDVEIYIKALTTNIHADTPTGASAGLHDLLEQLGLEGHAYPTGEPLYIWHTVPDHLDAEELKRLANRATPAPQHPVPASSPSRSAPRKTPGRPPPPPPGPPPTAPPRLPEKPVAVRTLPPISHRLKPRLATALFRRYLRACIPTGPDHAAPLAGARPEAVLIETQRVG